MTEPKFKIGDRIVYEFWDNEAGDYAYPGTVEGIIEVKCNKETVYQYRVKLDSCLLYEGYLEKLTEEEKNIASCQPLNSNEGE